MPSSLPRPTHSAFSSPSSAAVKRHPRLMKTPPPRRKGFLMESLEKALDLDLGGAEDISDYFPDAKEESPQVETQFKIASPHPRSRKVHGEKSHTHPASIPPHYGDSEAEEQALPGIVTRSAGGGAEGGPDGLFALNPLELRLKRSKRLAVARYYVDVNRTHTSSTQMSNLEERAEKGDAPKDGKSPEKVEFDSKVAVFHHELKLPDPDSCLGVRTALRLLRILPPRSSPSSDTYKTWEELDGSHKRLRMTRLSYPSHSLFEFPRMHAGSLSPSCFARNSLHSPF